MSSEAIDCLLIGYNEMQFAEYEKVIRSMGVNSESYQDLKLNFVEFQNKPYTALDMLNYIKNSSTQPGNESYNLGSIFGATISYLGTYLHRHGCTFDFINSFQNEKEELARKLKTDRILTIGITTTLYVSMLPIVEIISFIKQYNQSAKIIVGGPFVATNVRNQDELTLQFILDSIGADYFVNSSQGEATLIKIIDALKKGSPVDSIPNIYYQRNNEYSKTPIVLENNLLAENMVDWGLFSDRIDKLAMVRTAISCPFSCSFCGFPKHAGKYQTTDVEFIERELNTLDKIGKVESVYFIDDTFNVPAERFKEIVKMIIRNKYHFKWHSYFRCQFADREMIQLMEDSGCEGVFLGIESGNQQILKNMNKAATVEKYEEGMALLKESHIITFASFIVGFPGETAETFSDTMKFVERNQPDFYRAQLWYCEPITPIWEKRDQYQIKGSQFNWSHQTMNSKTGSKLVNELFLNVKKSIWISQHNFDFDTIFYLLHQGMSLAQIKNFVKGFNKGIKYHLLNPDHPEIDHDILTEMRNSFINC